MVRYAQAIILIIVKSRPMRPHFEEDGGLESLYKFAFHFCILSRKVVLFFLSAYKKKSISSSVQAQATFFTGSKLVTWRWNSKTENKTKALNITKRFLTIINVISIVFVGQDFTRTTSCETTFMYLDFDASHPSMWTPANHNYTLS